MTQEKRDMFGYRQLNLNPPTGYTTFSIGTNAALNTQGVLSSPNVMNTPTINKKGERQ